MGLSVGALAVAVVRSSSHSVDEAANQKLADAQEQIAALEAQKAKALDDAEKAKQKVVKTAGDGLDFGLGGAAETKEVVALDDVNKEEAGEADPAAQFAKLFNSKEARSLMKQFSGAAVNMMGQRAGDEIAKYKDKYGLTDDQVATLQTKLTAKLKEGTNKFASSLDNENKTVQEIMQEQGQQWQNQENEVAEIMKETLTDDQYNEFEREMLADRAQRVERNATRQMNRLDTQLNLDETQKDQVFGILVTNSPGFDPAMQVEGASVAPAKSVTPGEGEGVLIDGGVGALAGEIPAGIDAAALDSAAGNTGVSQEDAIRAVLTPAQVETYNKSLEQGGGNPWGGGFGFGR